MLSAVDKGVKVSALLGDEGDSASEGEGGPGQTTGTPGAGHTITSSVIVTAFPIFAITFFTN